LEYKWAPGTSSHPPDPAPLARPLDRGSGSEARGAAPKSKPGGVEWGQDKGQPDTSMAKDIDLFLV